jgi:hypothetical protein
MLRSEATQDRLDGERKEEGAERVALLSALGRVDGVEHAVAEEAEGAKAAVAEVEEGEQRREEADELGADGGARHLIEGVAAVVLPDD